MQSAPAFPMPIKVGNQGRRPCGQTEGFPQVGLGGTIVTLGVKVGLGGHQGAKGMHRRGVGGQRFEHVHQTIRNGHRGLEFLGERGQLVSIGRRWFHKRKQHSSKVELRAKLSMSMPTYSKTPFHHQ